MSAKKLLLVTYYWPPSGGGGVQRWLYLSKYLAEQGWDITVYTVNSDEYPTMDKGLESEIPSGIKVIRSEIWEPFTIYRKLTGKSKNYRVQASFANSEKGNPLLEKLALWVRSNFFIPDARRFWIKRSVKTLRKLNETENFDWVISSGPPHSCHLIARGLAEKTKVKWLADFRDPWTGIDYFEQLLLSKPALRKHQRLEQSVLQKANLVTTVGPTLAKELSQISQRSVEVFTNGFLDWLPEYPVVSSKKTLLHVGTMGPARNHSIFWEVLEELQNSNDLFATFEVLFVGNVDGSVYQEIENRQLQDIVKISSYVPAKEVDRLLMNAEALYLPVNDSKNAKGILTGKFFEYLSAQKPVISIGPLDGDINAILQETGAGSMVDFEDKEGFVQLLSKMLNGSLDSELEIQKDKVQPYQRKQIAARLGTLLQEHSVIG